MTIWEYARLEYRAAGVLGGDRFEDWDAIFVDAKGIHRWGTDERFDDLRHLNRAGKDGWQAFARGAAYIHGEPHRLSALTYSLRRPAPSDA